MLSLHIPESNTSTLLPPLACDCHMHVFDDRYPAAAQASLRPGNASMDDYQKLQDRLGSSRHVIVQPSVYGTDNSLLTDTLMRHRSTTRGVAVVVSSITEPALVELESAGVVGIRFNQVQLGATSMEMFSPLSSTMEELGWHMQMHLRPFELIEHEQLLSASPAPIVLDHFARAFEQPDLGPAVFSVLKRLLAAGNTWLKLSAPYLASQDRLGDYGDLATLTAELITAFPERLVWGTDWPHATESQTPDAAALADWLLRLMPDQATRHQIMVTNPAQLYHFER